MKKKAFKILIILSRIGHAFIISTAIYGITLGFGERPITLIIWSIFYCLSFITSAFGLFLMFKHKKPGWRLYLIPSVIQLGLFIFMTVAPFYSKEDMGKTVGIIPIVFFLAILKIGFMITYGVLINRGEKEKRNSRRMSPHK